MRRRDQQPWEACRRRLLSLVVLVTGLFKISGSWELVNNSAKPIIDKRETLKGSLGATGSAWLLRNNSIKN